MGGMLVNIYNNVNYALGQHARAIANLQEQTSTGSRINRVSDEPQSAYRLLGLGNQSKGLQRYMDNIVQTSDTLEVSSNVLNNMISLVSETQTDLTQITSGTYNQSGREIMAEQINDVLEQMLSYANTNHMDEYIFGGSSGDSPPYTAQRQNGKITAVNYEGSEQKRVIKIAQSVETTIQYTGQELFDTNNRAEPLFYGDTGASAGTGTSNAKGDVWLTVTHDGSNYKLSIDGGQTETTVPLAGDLGNIAVTDENGTVVYVDASEISQTGKNLIQFPGTYNVFNSLISIRDILNNTENLSQQQLTEFRDKIISSLEDVRSHLVNKQVAIGSRIGFMENLKTNLENIKYNAEEQSASIEQADISQIAIDLSMRETLYQMSLSVAGKLMSVSLLNFME